MNAIFADERRSPPRLVHDGPLAPRSVEEQGIEDVASECAAEPVPERHRRLDDPLARKECHVPNFGSREFAPRLFYAKPAENRDACRRHELAANLAAGKRGLLDDGNGSALSRKFDCGR
jgi:hypothetical protein